MPRRARVALPGVAWHIIQRGHNRQACFFADSDYQFYLATLATAGQAHSCAIHAYALMTNHVHLLLTPHDHDSASMLMKDLGQRYVQYVNRAHKRSGTLWEGRFKSSLAQDDAYVLACYRYIEMNPVRAGMVGRPDEYPWSSNRSNCLGTRQALLTPHADYLGLGASDNRRQSAYRALFEEPLADDLCNRIRSAVNGNVVTGDERFASAIADSLSRRVARGKAGRPRKATRNDEPVDAPEARRKRGLSPV